MSDESFFDDNRDAERRESDDRRKEEIAPPEDRRMEPQRDRRQSTDRRGWPFGLILRTTESYRVIEEWLEDNCGGEYGFGLEDIDENLAQKSFKVMFELETDKNTFVSNFSKR
jgi:hypothetical protein